MFEWILMLSALLAAVTSAISSAISAKNAHDANRTMARVDRERRVREISLLANRVLQAAEFVDHLAPLLKKAYADLFTSAGQAPPSNSGRYNMLSNKIDQKQTKIEPAKRAAEELLKTPSGKWDDEQIIKYMLDLDGHLATLDWIREQLREEHASVESRNLMYFRQTVEETR